MKICCRCRKSKTESFFHKNKRRFDGLNSYCKACDKASRTSPHGKEIATRASKKYYSSEKGYNVHKRSNQKYRSSSKGKLSSLNYHRNRIDNVEYRITKSLRSRLYNAVRGLNKASTLLLLGCSKSFLMEYLESQFTKGMTWENYGKWHIDHIKPCASFDLSIEENQRKCFHYTNLQPLWAKDNLIKGSKYDTYLD